MLKPLTFLLISLPFLMAAAGPATSTAPATGTAPATASQPAVRLSPLKVGEKAPDFTLKTLDAKEVHLAALTKDAPVVLIELRGWVGYQCPNCTAQTNDFITHAKELLADGVKVVFVYPGPAAGLQAHAEEFITGKGLPEGFFFVTDPDKNFVASWGLLWNKTGETAYPATFVIDKENTVRFASVSNSHAGRATSAEVIKALAAVKAAPTTATAPK